MKLGRLPLLALAVLGLVLGVWAGLARLGWGFAGGAAALTPSHGPLMVCAFFGALIGLERAVAHGAKWTFVVPLLAGASAISALVGSARGPALSATAAAAGFSLVSLLLARRHVADFSVVLTVAALAWLAGNALWSSGAAIDRVLPWWMVFLILTILAERRELGRVIAPPPIAGWLFGLSSALLVCAAAASLLGLEYRRLMAAALGLSTLWLALFDVARFTVRKRGLTRFIAVCLLGGYVWLGVGAVLTATNRESAGPGYDAMVHALLLGFVFSMVFAHAPIVFPAILGAPLHYRPSFYAHVLLLHVSLGARIAGDVVASPALRMWGGLGNAAALVVFFAASLRSVIAGRPTPAKMEAR